MLGAAAITARIVGHEEVPYSDFKDSGGNTVPGGVTHWVTLAAPGTGETVRAKCKPEVADKLRDAWWGGECTVHLTPFAKNGRVTYSIREVVSVQKPLPGINTEG